MTPPIPQGHPRQRPSRSCVACRRCKTRCKGADQAEQSLVNGFAVDKCERCSKMSLDCEFVPLKRKGRPRRLPRLDSEEPAVSTHQQQNTLLQRKRLSSEAGSSSSSSSSPVAGPSPKSPPSTFVNYQSSYENGQLVKLGSKRKRADMANDAWTKATLNKSALQDITSTPFPMPFSVSPPFDVPSLAQELAVGSPRSQHVDNLAQGYIAMVHAFLPILTPSYDYLVDYLKAATPLLSLALSTILTPHSELSIDPKLFGSTLQDVQAALVFVYWAYGRGDLPLSLRLFKWVETQIVAFNWHKLDEPGRASKDAHIASLSEQEKEMIRSIFWESWCVEITLGSMAGFTKFPLHDIEARIFQPQVARSDRCYGPSPFSLRIRCFSILSTVVRKATAGFSSEELSTMSDICRNLAALSHQSYVASAKAVSQTRNASEYALATADCEAAFMAGLSAAAGIVFMASLPNFVPTAFVCGHDTTKHAPRSMYEAMRSGASKAFQLCQATLAPTTSPMVHSPFFTCALFVSAQGIITTVRDDPDVSEMTTASVFSDLEIGEFILDQGTQQWLGAHKILNEIQMLRLSIANVDDAISTRIVRPGAHLSGASSSSAASSSGGDAQSLPSSPAMTKVNQGSQQDRRLTNPVAALLGTFGGQDVVSTDNHPILNAQTVAPAQVHTVAPSMMHL